MESCRARKVPLLKKAHVQARLKFTNDLEENWVKCCGQIRPKLSSLALTQLAVFGGGVMLPVTPKTASPPSNMEVETLCFGGCLFLQRGQDNYAASKGTMDGAMYRQGQGIENGLWMGIPAWQWPQTHSKGNKELGQEEAHEGPGVA